MVEKKEMTELKMRRTRVADQVVENKHVVGAYLIADDIRELVRRQNRPMTPLLCCDAKRSLPM